MQKRVRTATLYVGSKARYFRPCRYVDRWPKRQSNNFGSLLIIDIYSPETASKQRSQRSDARVLHTEKLRLFLCMAPCDWLEDIAAPSADTHETGSTAAPGSCERGRRPARSPSVARQSPAIGAECNSPAAEHLADYGQDGVG